MTVEILKTTLLAWAADAPSCYVAPVAAPSDDKKPWVQLPGPGWVLSQCAAALGDILAVHPIYARAGLAMWPNHRGDGLELVLAKAFASWVERYVTMFSYVSKSKEPLSLTNEDAGRLLAAPDFLARLREVERLNPVRLPTMRKSGAIELLPPGYDAESKTLTLAALDYRVDMPYADGWEIIAGLIEEFPFAKEPLDDEQTQFSADRNRAVALGAMFGVYARGLLPKDSLAPAYLYVANAEGAGKTLLASLALIPVFGAVNVKGIPKDEEKLKQELLSAVMCGTSHMLFDNWRGQVGSPNLEAFITSTYYGGRIMRENKDFFGPKEVEVFITGNNCTTNGDMRRRSLMCELFVEEARSEDRKIVKRMDVAAVTVRRAEILAALWSVVKQWDASGRPPCSMGHGSFESWARTIGGIVESMGLGCCMGESRSTRSGDLYLQQMTKLCEESLKTAGHDVATPLAGQDDARGCGKGLRARLKFEEVVGVAQEAGLFEELLEEDKDGNLDRKGKATFAKLLKRYDSRVFKGTIRMSADGAGHGRRYIFELLGGS